MVRLLLLSFLFLFAACKTTTYYISRHAEKAGSMSSDPPLTAFGQEEAKDLQAYLKDKKIGAVYSTNFLRTRATAQPTSDFFRLPVNLYDATKSTALVDSLKAHNRRNVLIVGHSNTVDDMVNRFVESNAISDLPDSEYGALFIVKKKGNRYNFQKIAVPRTTAQ